MQENVYVELTRVFNAGRLRAILSSGQAVVLHRLAVMSKDGDWILEEDEETCTHILAALEARGARYRFGAPLHPGWLAGGWSSHFEFSTERLRVRTDFISRPPRVSREALAALWKDTRRGDMPVPFVDVVNLAQLKKTRREKDYAVIGELARLIEDPEDRLLLSRSARDIVALASAYPEAFEKAASRRELLYCARDGIEALEVALDAERRRLMHADERRVQCYLKAAEAWAETWPRVSAEIAGKGLEKAHETIVARAEELLPCTVQVPEE